MQLLQIKATDKELYENIVLQLGQKRFKISLDVLWSSTEIQEFTTYVNMTFNLFLTSEEMAIVLFDRRGASHYYQIKSDVKDFISLMSEEDPLMKEHILLSGDIRANLYNTPFMVKCDDYDFVVGALETALAEVKEPEFYNWGVRHDYGEYYEIFNFIEEQD